MTSDVLGFFDGEGGRASITATCEFGSLAKSQMFGFSLRVARRAIEEEIAKAG